MEQIFHLCFKFMIKDDQSQVNEDRIMQKQQVQKTFFFLFENYFLLAQYLFLICQNVVIRHLCSLLGYNQTSRTFVNLPSKIRFSFIYFSSLIFFFSLFSRRSPVFHAFLSNLPKVLDYNFNLGTLLLPFFLSFLQFSTCSNVTIQFYDHTSASNTLGRIDPNLRDSWLMTLIIILYKVYILMFLVF